MKNSLPILGASVSIKDLRDIPGLKDFILARNRDVEITDFISVEALRGDWRTIAETAAAALDGHGGRIGIHGAFYGFDIDSYDPDVRAIVKRRMDAGLEACRIASGGRGGAHLVVHSPYSTWRWYNRGTAPGREEALIERVHLALGDAVRKAEDYGITIVIENIEDKDPLDRVRLAQSFESKSVRVSLDTGHAHYAHGATGAPPVDVFVRSAGKSLAHVHLQDTDSVADRHWAIGEGTIAWRAVFRALGELDEMPRLVIELTRAREIQPSAAWLEAQGLAI